MIDDPKQRLTSSPSGQEALQQLMEEMVDAKQAVQDVLKISPEDIQLHRIHGMYTGHILDIRKTMMQEQAVDRDQLLIDALKGVVNFLLQKGQGESAQFIGDHLEEIGNKVKTILAGFKNISKLADGYDGIRKLIARALTPFGKTTPKQKEARQKARAQKFKILRRNLLPALPDRPAVGNAFVFLPVVPNGSRTVQWEKLLVRSSGPGPPDGSGRAAGSCQVDDLFPHICRCGALPARKRKFIGLVSDTTEQAADFLEFIKAELDANERLREDFPEACGEGKVWKAGAGHYPQPHQTQMLGQTQGHARCASWARAAGSDCVRRPGRR